MTHPEFPQPVFCQSDQHLTCLCGAILIRDFRRLAQAAPGLFRDINVPCFRCVGVGQASLDDLTQAKGEVREG